MDRDLDRDVQTGARHTAAVRGQMIWSWIIYRVCLAPGAAAPVTHVALQMEVTSAAVAAKDEWPREVYMMHHGGNGPFQVSVNEARGAPLRPRGS